MESLLCFNGTLYAENCFLWSAENRAFRYGDSLFETIHANGINIQFLQEHLNRLIKGMETIGMLVPSDFRENIEKNMLHLIQKNKAFGGTRIRLSVFRNNGGFYTPTDNSVSYLIETSPLKDANYTLNRKGLKLGIYNEIRKPYNILSQFKTGNSLPFIMAGNYCKSKNLDDCFLLNERGSIVESCSSNLFVVKNGVLLTPSLESGAVSGIMREQIIRIALRLNLTAYDDCILKLNDLLTADEIFLTNAIHGIQWVVAFEERRYFNRTAKLLVEELNRMHFTS